MGIYYGLLAVAAVLYGIQFLFNDFYEKQCGNRMASALILMAGANTIGFIFALAINHFKFDYTSFSLLLAFIYALFTLFLTLLGLKSLERINLSLYSVYMMIGGMTLPFVYGLFCGESLTLGKILCFVFSAASVLTTIEKGNGNKGKTNWLLYLSVFLLNGSYGILAKAFSDSTAQKVDENGFSVLCAAACALSAFVLLPFFWKSRPKFNRKAVVGMIGFGAVNRVAEWLLLVALAGGMPASAQFPFITGGTMIASTLLCFFTAKKPNIRNALAVAIAFVGVVCLVLFESVTF